MYLNYISTNEIPQMKRIEQNKNLQDTRYNLGHQTFQPSGSILAELHPEDNST